MFADRRTERKPGAGSGEKSQEGVVWVAVPGKQGTLNKIEFHLNNG